MNPTVDDAHENAYSGLVEADDDARWAFGTGFADPLAGVDTTVPAGVDAAALAAYCLGLGDDALVMAQRLAQWCTRAPELEEEVALANIGLDLLGQTRLLYARAARADPAVVPPVPAGSPVPDEDRLAFFREPAAFRCVWLVEVPHGDFATAVVRVLLFASWRLALLDGLRASADPVLAAVGEKGLKELRYHRDWAARWCLVLAGGTAESRSRTEAALTQLWPYVDELGRPDPAAAALPGVAVDPAAAWRSAHDVVAAVLAEAGLAVPQGSPAATADDPAGRAGVHTRWFDELVGEMQSVARAHPEGRW